LLADNIDVRLFRMSKSNSELWNFFSRAANWFLFYSSHCQFVDYPLFSEASTKLVWGHHIIHRTIPPWSCSIFICWLAQFLSTATNCWEIKLTLWSSKSFWNISLVFKFVVCCNYLLVLQWNMFYSKSNQHATRFLQHRSYLNYCSCSSSGLSFNNSCVRVQFKVHSYSCVTRWFISIQVLT